jgi:hypothetical protein
MYRNVVTNYTIVHVYGMRKCLITAETNRPVVHPQMIYEYAYGETWRNYIDRDKPEKLGEKCVPLSTTNPTWTDQGANTSLHGERPAAYRLTSLRSMCYGGCGVRNVCG